MNRVVCYQLIFLLLLHLSPSLISAQEVSTKKYIDYKVSYDRMRNFPELYDQFIRSHREAQKYHYTVKHFREQLDIFMKVVKVDPEWVDAYWLVGSLAFQLGSSYTKTEDIPKARKLFVIGRNYGEKCLSMAPESDLCKMVLASNIGKIGTIDGLLVSLKYAKRVEDLWTDVLNSPYNFQFTHEVSMQGAVRYGLGMFYRLIPDFFLMDWIWDVRGDIKKSVRLHRESLHIDNAELPCSYVMLSVALICSVDGDANATESAEAKKLLTRASRFKPLHPNQVICHRDTFRLLQDPTKAFGYTLVGKLEAIDESEVTRKLN